MRGTLSPDQYLRFNQENEAYFQAHPELAALIRVYLNDLLAEKPQNVWQFTESFFGDGSVLKERLDANL